MRSDVKSLWKDTGRYAKQLRRPYGLSGSGFHEKIHWDLYGTTWSQHDMVNTSERNVMETCANAFVCPIDVKFAFCED